MSPLEISIALHYHYSCDEFRNGDLSAPAVQDALKYFVMFEMLEYDEERIPMYEPTERMTAYVKKLCSIDLPSLSWGYNE